MSSRTRRSDLDHDLLAEAQAPVRNRGQEHARVILVDTSIWIDQLRKRGRRPTRSLGPVTRADVEPVVVGGNESAPCRGSPSSPSRLHPRSRPRLWGPLRRRRLASTVGPSSRNGLIWPFWRNARALQPGRGPTSGGGVDGNQMTDETGCILEIVPNERLLWTAGLTTDYRPQAGPMPFTAILELQPDGAGGCRYRAAARALGRGPGLTLLATPWLGPRRCGRGRR